MSLCFKEYEKRDLLSRRHVARRVPSGIMPRSGQMNLAVGEAHGKLDILSPRQRRLIQLPLTRQDVVLVTVGFAHG